jgi:hypothetical protein
MSKIRLNGTTSGYTEIAPPATAGDNTITLPSSNGSANQFLKNGSTAGTLGWSSMVETATGVGIGTSSPEAVLQTVATSSGAATVGAFLQNYSATTNTEVRLAFGPAANSLSDNRYAWIGCVNTGGSNGTAFTFNTGPGGTAAAERARITSGGLFQLATTSLTSGIANIFGYADGGYVGVAMQPTANNSTPFSFRNAANTQVGSISCTSSATAYNTSSDYRLKENVAPLTGAVDRLVQLPVHRFNFIADPDRIVDGFLAHEVQDVVPEAITGTKDEVDADGNPIYQGIDQSKLVPLLTAALQEALTEIADLKARITALEAV